MEIVLTGRVQILSGTVCSLASSTHVAGAEHLGRCPQHTPNLDDTWESGQVTRLDGTELKLGSCFPHLLGHDPWLLTPLVCQCMDSERP